MVGSSEEPTNARGRVLVVDDDDDVRELVTSIVTAAGYLAVPASNGAEALRELQANSAHFALLLTDIVMPNLNGFQLAERARQLRADLPILYISGYVEAMNMPESRHGELIRKPFRPAELMASVERAIGTATF